MRIIKYLPEKIYSGDKVDSPVTIKKSNKYFELMGDIAKILIRFKIM